MYKFYTHNHELCAMLGCEPNGRFVMTTYVCDDVCKLSGAVGIILFGRIQFYVSHRCCRMECRICLREIFYVDPDLYAGQCCHISKRECLMYVLLASTTADRY